MNTKTEIEKRGWCHINFEITLEGKSIRFEDLSESNQEYICRKLSDGYRTIEICETPTNKPELIDELMRQYDKNRDRWIKKFKNDNGFNNWFTQQVENREKEEKA